MSENKEEEAISDENRTEKMKEEQQIVSKTASQARELKNKIKILMGKEGELCSFLDGIDQCSDKKEELIKIGTPYVAKLDDYA